VYVGFSCEVLWRGDAFGSSACYFSGTLHHQYDSMAYPYVAGKKRDFQVPRREVMQAEALKIYLRKYEKLLRDCELSEDDNVERVSQSMEKIYRMLNNALVGASNEKHRGTWRATWPCPELDTVSVIIR
jgi:hypothetical protein